MAGRVVAAAVFVLVLKMDIEALPYSYAVGWVLMLVYEVPRPRPLPEGWDAVNFIVDIAKMPVALQQAFLL